MQSYPQKLLSGKFLKRQQEKSSLLLWEFYVCYIVENGTLVY